jgi:hypothetical protein
MNRARRRFFKSVTAMANWAALAVFGVGFLTVRKREVCMRRITVTVGLALVAAVVFASARAAAREPEAKLENKLIGTWKLVSAKYGNREAMLPAGWTRLKHVTTTHFMWANYDEEGKVSMALGGPYTKDGNKYEELPEYGVGNVLQLLKGKPQPFDWKVEGNKWYHNGKLSSGTTIEEVWERVQNK